MSKYALLEHSSEAKLIVQGHDAAGLFRQAGREFTDIITDVDEVLPQEKYEIKIEAESQEELLVEFLRKLLFLFDADRVLFSKFEIQELSPQRLRAEVWGEGFDADRHLFKTEVKAVTHYQLKVEETKDGLRACVILEI